MTATFQLERDKLKKCPCCNVEKPMAEFKNALKNITKYCRSCLDKKAARRQLNKDIEKRMKEKPTKVSYWYLENRQPPTG